MISFSGFSVGFCINEGKVIWYQLELGKPLADVSTECSSRHEYKSEEVGINVAIYSHALLKIHVVGGQRLDKLLISPCHLITAVQQPGTLSPSSRLKCSSEGVIWLCRASFTNSYCPLHGPALWSSPRGSGGDPPMHAPLQLTSPSSLSRRHPCFPSVFSPVSVWSP